MLFLTIPALLHTGLFTVLFAGEQDCQNQVGLGSVLLKM